MESQLEISSIQTFLKNKTMRDGLKVIPVTTLPSVLEPNQIYNIAGTLAVAQPDGTPALIGPIVQQVVLVAGTKVIDLSTGPFAGLVKTTSKAILTLAVVGNAALTVERQVVCTANTVTITALLGAHTINAADTSTVNLAIYP